MAVGPETIVGQNPQIQYVTHNTKDTGSSNDMRKGGIHVMHPLSSLMFLDFMSGTTDILGYPVRYNLRNEHYVIRLDNPDNTRNRI